MSRRRAGINARERTVLAVVVELADEFPGRAIAREAIEHVLGEPAAGSLASLAMDGYIAQRMSEGHVCYQPTPKGRRLHQTATRTQIDVPR